MSRVAFFCIPAWGHTNPTVEVVRQLTAMGHLVRYYSFEPFREKLESAGAEVVCCDEALPRCFESAPVARCEGDHSVACWAV